MRKGDAGRGERSLRVAYIGEDGLPYAENVYSAGDGTLVFGAAISLLNEKWRGGEPHAPAFEGLRLSADWRVYADGRRSRYLSGGSSHAYYVSGQREIERPVTASILPARRRRLSERRESILRSACVIWTPWILRTAARCAWGTGRG